MQRCLPFQQPAQTGVLAGNRSEQPRHFPTAEIAATNVPFEAGFAVA